MTTRKWLIDVDVAMKRAKESDKIVGSSIWETCEVVEFLEDCPTVDAVEVVHGEWVVCGDGEYVPFMCSACGKTTSWYHAQTANYCPNCGADMRDGGKHE